MRKTIKLAMLLIAAALTASSSCADELVDMTETVVIEEENDTAVTAGETVVEPSDELIDIANSGIEVVDVEQEDTQESLSVTGILETHDVYTLCSQSGPEEDMTKMIQPVLPGTITLFLSNGTSTSVPVSGAWTLDMQNKCFVNSASVPAGVTDPSNLLGRIEIRYAIELSSFGMIAYTGTKTDGKDVNFSISLPMDLGVDSTRLYKTQKSGDAYTSTLIFDSLTMQYEMSDVFPERDTFVYTKPVTEVSDSGLYFALCYNNANRTGSVDVPIYMVVFMGNTLQVEHSWGVYKRDPGDPIASLRCKYCDTLYDQVYNPLTGERYETERPREEVKAEMYAQHGQPVEPSTLDDQKETDEIESEKNGTVIPKVKWKSIKKKGKAVTLKWRKVKGASYYEIYYKVGEKGKYRKLKQTTKLSYVHKKLKKSKVYYYKVRAVVKTGKKVTKGSFSKAKKRRI